MKSAIGSTIHILLFLFLVTAKSHAAPIEKSHLPAAHQVTITVGAKSSESVNRKIFGGCYNDLRHRADEWEYMGLTTCREGRPHLQSPQQIEPEPGVWKWKRHDKWLDWLKANNVTGIAVLSGAAKWMKKGGQKEPADWGYFISEWSKFAAEVVRHTNIERKAGLKYWEIWNEPDDGHWFKKPWGGDPEHYSALFNAAVKAMKAVDPTIKVGTGGIADPENTLSTWWEPCLRDFGVAGTLDFVCLHGYYGNPTNGRWYETLKRTRKLMNKYIGREVPIWVTEFNASHVSFVKRGLYSFEEQALYVAETLAVFAQQNVEAAQYFCIGWYGSDFCPWDEKGARRPIVDAYHFWRDYRTDRLPVQVSGIDNLAAVACRHHNTRVLYLPCDRPGSRRVRFEGVDIPEHVTAEAFYGDRVDVLPVGPPRARGSCIELCFTWPEGRHALVKIQLRETK